MYQQKVHATPGHASRKLTKVEKKRLKNIKPRERGESALFLPQVVVLLRRVLACVGCIVAISTLLPTVDMLNFSFPLIIYFPLFK